MSFSKDEIINQFRDGRGIEQICIDYHAKDKADGKRMGYKPATVKEAREKVYAIILEYQSQEGANNASNSKQNEDM